MSRPAVRVACCQRTWLRVVAGRRDRRSRACHRCCVGCAFIPAGQSATGWRMSFARHAGHSRRRQQTRDMDDVPLGAATVSFPGHRTAAACWPSPRPVPPSTRQAATRSQRWRRCRRGDPHRVALLRTASALALVRGGADQDVVVVTLPSATATPMRRRVLSAQVWGSSRGRPTAAGCSSSWPAADQSGVVPVSWHAEDRRGLTHRPPVLRVA